jgi:hypothetical protein
MNYQEITDTILSINMMFDNRTEELDKMCNSENVAEITTRMNELNKLRKTINTIFNETVN